MWNVQDKVALWESKLLHAQFDLCRPDLGLHRLLLNATGLEDLSVLQTRLEACDTSTAQLSDVVCRLNELTVSYAETEGQPIQRQLQWKIFETVEPLSVIVDLLVFVQTSQLDSDPRLVISSSASSTSWLQLVQVDRQSQFQKMEAVGATTGCPIGAYVTALPENGLHYTQLLLPSDEMNAQSGVLAADGGQVLRTVLFSERLEKGVIRCARIRGVFREGEPNASIAMEVAEEFRRSKMSLGVM
jgi:hypothetical protein